MWPSLKILKTSRRLGYCSTKQVRNQWHSPEGKYSVSGSSDGAICLREMGKDTPQCRLTGHEETVNSVTYSPDGKRIASGGGSILIWNTNFGTASEPQILFAGDQAIYRWDTENPGERDTLKEIVFSNPENHAIIAQNLDGEAPEGEPSSSLGHSNHVTALSYSPDRKYIAFDRTIRIWNADTKSPRTIDMMPLYVMIGGKLPLHIPSDGWIRAQSGDLLLFVPFSYRNGACDRSIKCIPPDAPGHTVRLDRSKLKNYAGPSWTRIGEQLHPVSYAPDTTVGLVQPVCECLLKEFGRFPCSPLFS
ncbi:hypothetical protein DFH11DRAFT_1258753 [Phellopilus nigrolimitatus]|nr:hypothetical protein DFH11DRAFT_1258753 [Phellopilus nigrolimitatus]